MRRPDSASSASHAGRGWAALALRLLLVTAAFYVAARIGLRLADAHEHPVPGWLMSGPTLAALLVAALVSSPLILGWIAREIAGSIRAYHDLTERRYAEQSLQRIAEGISGVTGEAFFHSLVHCLCDTLDADVASVSALLPGSPVRAGTIALRFDGRILPNMEYPLAGTPCEDVFRDATCIVVTGVQERYPDDAVLAEWGIDSYLGQGLVGSDGRMLGILNVMSRRSQTHPQRAEALLRIFAVRATAELERLAGEQALRQSEEHYRTLFEQSPVGVALYDCRLQVTAANAALTRIWQIDAERLTGADLAQTVDPRIMPVLRDVLRGRAGRYDGACNVGSTGGTVWVALQASPRRDEHGEVIGGICLVENVTERKQAVDRWRSAERRLATFSEATTDAVYEWDVRSDQLWWSPGIKRLFGYDPDAFANDPTAWSSRVHPDDLPRVNASIDTALEDGTTETLEEYRFRRADDSYAHVLERGYIIRDLQRRPVRMIGALIDLTERRAAEEALRRTEEQLRQAQKMEAVGRLAGGIAHDFNNLLTSILGFADLVLEELPADDPHRADIVEIRSAGQRAGALTRQLLAFSRKQVIEPKVVDPNAVVTSVGAMLRRLIGEDVSLDMRLAPTAGWVKVDPGQLEQVLMNFAVNARDAMPEGGQLTIATGNVELDDAAAAAIELLAGAYVTITVQDTGHGMDDATQARIFEPFFTTKERGKGTGLGLAMVYGFARQSGGAVAVASRPGAGAAFTLYLPGVAASGEPLAAPVDEPAKRGTETVLLVEDEAPVRDLTHRVLRNSGYRVLVAANAEEALQVAGALDHPIDLLLTDVVMPGMSGPKLARELAESRPGMQVLFMSGYTDTPMVQEDVLEREAAFLQKPFLPNTLARRIRVLLDTPKKSR